MGAVRNVTPTETIIRDHPTVRKDCSDRSIDVRLTTLCYYVKYNPVSQCMFYVGWSCRRLTGILGCGDFDGDWLLPYWTEVGCLLRRGDLLVVTLVTCDSHRALHERGGIEHSNAR